jgi:ribonuclease P protein component
MRYARQQHLRSAADFQPIRASGSRWECGFFYALFLNRPGRIPPLRRLGVIASRRVGNAVARNRAKRRLRALFRLHQGSLPPSCDIILIARSAIHNAPFGDLERRFEGAVKRHAGGPA